MKVARHNVSARGMPERTGVRLDEAPNRQQADPAPGQSSAFLGAIFNQTSAGLVQTDLTGRILLVNDPCCRIVGRTREELLTLRWQDLMHPDDLPASAGPFRRCVEEGCNFALEARYVRPVGSPRWVRTSGALVRGTEGRPQSVLMTLCDVTEHKRAEGDLLDADRRKDEFVALLAHELRNPLGCLKNSLEVIKCAGDHRELLDQACGIMERQRLTMQRLIDDLQAMTRISHGKLELHRERVTLAVVLRDAVEEVRPLIDNARHEVVITLPPEANYLEADPVRLVQVFSNLLANASKYTDSGGRISVTAKRQGWDVVVSIKDTGIGISAEHLPHLFAMFAQVDSALDRSKGGLGIGLALVRGLVELHGGSVTAHSEGLGRGSEFVVRLPASGAPSLLPIEPRPDPDPMASR